MPTIPATGFSGGSGFGPNTAFAGDDSPGFFGTGQYQPNAQNFYIPGYTGYQQTLGNYLAGVDTRGTPQLDPSQQGQFRDQQTSLAQALAAQANGQGPSVAQAQLGQATDRNLSQALALAQSAGANNAGALRNVAYQRGDISQQAAGDAATLRLQEQMQARNQLGQVLAGARGQDLGLAGQNAQLQQQQTGINDAAVRAYLSMGMTLAQAQAQANMNYEQLRQNSFYNTANNSIGGKVVGGLLNAGGAAAGGYASGAAGAAAGGG